MTITESKWLNLLATVYGPYAFGVISLLLIWYTIVGPQLKLQAVDYKSNQELLNSLQEVTSTNKEVAKTLERTAASHEVVTQALERTVLTLNEIMKDAHAQSSGIAPE